MFKAQIDVPPVKLADITLKWVHGFTYLGHHVTNDLKDDVENKRRAVSVRLTMILSSCIFFYACSFWINIILHSGHCCGCPICSASGMFAETRMNDFYAVIHKRVATILMRTRHSFKKGPSIRLREITIITPN